MLMQALISCASKTVVVYQVPEVAKPRFPDPWPVVFVDEDGFSVIEEGPEIIEVRMPYWYWNKIIEYKSENDVVYETLHPG